MSNIHAELPQDARELINSPPTPFDEVPGYHGELGLYELSRREEPGYNVVLLWNCIGETMLSTVIEKKGRIVGDIPTPPDRALDGLNHAFRNADPRVVERVIPRAA